MTRKERSNFQSYLHNCTDAQVQGVWEKEHRAGRRPEQRLAEAEAKRRGFSIERKGRT